jgi:hypothetical protein
VCVCSMCAFDECVGDGKRGGKKKSKEIPKGRASLSVSLSLSAFPFLVAG